MSLTSLPSLTTIPLAIFPIIVIFIIIFFTKPVRSSHRLPPGPTPLPIIGCTIQMVLNRPTFRWIHKLMDQFHTPILCIRLGPSTHVIVVSSPTLACEFLKKQDRIFASRPEISSAYLTSGNYRTTALSPFGDQWRKMIKIIKQNILSLPIHKWLQPKRDEEANHLRRYICNQIEKQNMVNGGGLINIRFASQHYCGNLIRNMIFGTRFFGKGNEDGGPGEEEIEHIAAVFTILKHLYAFSVSDYFPWLRGKIDFDGHEKILRTSIQSVRKYQDPLIDKRIQMWEHGDRKVEDDLLDILVRHESPKLTPEEIKAQIIELMIAAIDNPSNTVEWTMAELINEPRILKRAVEELDIVVGRERFVEERDLPQLNYIKACLKESFRLHPLNPLNIPHVSMMDTIVAGYFIPKDSHVLLSRYGLGRNPNVWMNPMRFDPDRHLCVDGNEVVLSDNELKMLSFSTGIRGCPGVLLGSTITTTLFASMVQGFTWEIPHNEFPLTLDENHNDLNLAKPLILIAKQRLPQYLYANI